MSCRPPPPPSDRLYMLPRPCWTLVCDQPSSPLPSPTTPCCTCCHPLLPPSSNLFLLFLYHVSVFPFVILLGRSRTHSLTRLPAYPPTHAFAPRSPPPTLPCLVSFCLSACQDPGLSMKKHQQRVVSGQVKLGFIGSQLSVLFPT